MAKLFSLNYKRNVNYFTDGNPETRWPHILNTVGIGKANQDPGIGLGAGSTLTRSTTGTLFDFEGILRYAKVNEARFQGARRVENLVPLSESITSGGARIVVTSNAIANPVDGAITADKAAADSTVTNTHEPKRVALSVITQVYCAQVWVKAAGLNYIQIRIGGANGVMFNVGAGTIGTVSGTVINYSMTPYANGWYLCQVTANCAADATAYYLMSADGIATTFTGDNVAGIYVWGFIVTNLSSQSNQNPDTYISSGVLSTPWYGAGVDAVKYYKNTNGNIIVANHIVFGNGTLIGTPITMLNEGTTTNYQTYSDDLTNVIWVPNGTVVVASAAVAPDGRLTAEKVNTLATNAFHRISNDSSVTIGNTYTQSLFVKAGEYSFIQFAGSTGFDSVNLWVNFNLSNGTVGNKGSTATTYSIIPCVNGWYYISLTAIATATSAAARFLICLIDTDQNARQPVFIGTANAGVYVWGSDLEDGTLSSHIPTVATSVTRAADVYTP